MESAKSFRDDLMTKIRSSRIKEIINAKRSLQMGAKIGRNIDQELLNELDNSACSLVSIDIESANFVVFEEELLRFNTVVHQIMQTNKASKIMIELMNRYNVVDCLFWILINVAKEHQEIEFLVIKALVNLSSSEGLYSMKKCPLVMENNLNSMIEVLKSHRKGEHFDYICSFFSNILIDFASVIKILYEKGVFSFLFDCIRNALIVKTAESLERAKQALKLQNDMLKSLEEASFISESIVRPLIMY